MFRLVAFICETIEEFSLECSRYSPFPERSMVCSKLATNPSRLVCLDDEPEQSRGGDRRINHNE